MRHLYLILCLFIALYSRPATAAIITAVQNGNWNTKATWDGRKVPDDNDIVIIPASITVLLKNTPYPKNVNTRPVIEINIYGTLDFSDNGVDKLYLQNGSKIQVYAGGKIQTSNGSAEILAIYNGVADNTLWVGSPLNQLGPAYGTSTTAGFMNGTLPLTFTAFDASLLKEGSVRLTWSASEEINTSHFEVEALLPGSNNWKYEGRVEANGNSGTNINYAFTVTDIATGNIQFRLKQVDNDGHYTYSMIRNIIGTGKNLLSLWYDQHAALLHVSGLSENSGKTNIDLFDLNGIQHFHQARQGTVVMQQLPTVNRGIYVVRLTNDAGILFSKKILVN